MTTKVCIVAPVHDSDDVRVFHKEAVSLAKHGYNVHLLTRAAHISTKHTVNIHPVITVDRSRLLRFLCLPLVAFQALRLRADIYHLHNPDTLPIALILKICGKKIIYDTHEDFSQRILYRHWIPRIMRRPIAALVAATESAIAVLSNASIGTQEAVVARLGKNAKLIANSPIVNTEIQNLAAAHGRQSKEQDSTFRAVYIGSINELRGLSTMVNAMALVNESMSARLWLIGPAIDSELDAMQTNSGWEFVDYLPKMPQIEAFGFVLNADVGLICIQDKGDHRHTDPNKLYEYMAFGVPFIASDFDKWRTKLEEVNAGWFIPANDSAALAKSIVHSALHKTESLQRGQNGKLYSQEHSWSVDEKQLLALYEAVLG